MASRSVLGNNQAHTPPGTHSLVHPERCLRARALSSGRCISAPLGSYPEPRARRFHPGSNLAWSSGAGGRKPLRRAWSRSVWALGGARFIWAALDGVELWDLVCAGGSSFGEESAVLTWRLKLAPGEAVQGGGGWGGRTAPQGRARSGGGGGGKGGGWGKGVREVPAGEAAGGGEVPRRVGEGQAEPRPVLGTTSRSPRHLARPGFLSPPCAPGSHRLIPRLLGSWRRPSPRCRQRPGLSPGAPWCPASPDRVPSSLCTRRPLSSGTTVG